VLDGNGLARYLADYAKQQGGSLSSGDARLLIDRVGLNQLILQHEVDKLVSYDPKISRASIELLTDRTPQSSIFELLDAAFAGNVKRAMSLYGEQRTARVEPQQILAMLIWQLHILAVVKTAGPRSADTIAKEAKISPFTVRKSVDLARRLSLTQLKTRVSDLLKIDLDLKSKSMNADEALQLYLLRLA
jgi:DNA polymerase-3 subunit delta